MTWALIIGGLVTVGWLIRWRRSGLGWFERLELDVMYLFARLWHRCVPGPPAPLPEQGPAIVIANHPSHADPAFLLACSNRPLRFLQARECYAVPLLRFLFARVGCIPVARHGRDIGGIRRALRQLARGEVLAIFPEGDVGLGGRGGLGPGKPGAALLALRSGAPVIPAWIAGGPEPTGSLADWLRPSPGVRVRFGPPIDLAAYRGRPITPPLLRAVTARLMQGVAQLASSPQNEGLTTHVSGDRWTLPSNLWALVGCGTNDRRITPISGGN